MDPADTSGAFALMRATVPAGIGIPLHSHADPEVFFILEGLLEVWQYDGGSGRWLTATYGDVICIPGDVRHAIRNASSSTVMLLLITTPKLYEFFRELARPFHSEEKAEAPNDRDMQRLLALAARYNYWIGSAQENEVIGFSKFPQMAGLGEH